MLACRFSRLFSIIPAAYLKKVSDFKNRDSYRMPLWNSYLIDLTEGHKTELLISIVRILKLLL